MASNNNSGGPWGGGGGNRGGSGGGGRGGPWGSGDGNQGGGNRGGGQGGGGRGGGQGPDIDQIVRKGQEQLKVLMGGRGGSGGGGGGGGAEGLGKGGIALILLALAGAWLWMSFYTVRPEEQSVELFLGEFSSVGESGLNFAPWPFVTKEVRPVTNLNEEDIGTGDSGLMLTGDENIVDIDFKVFWNISNLSEYLFNLAEPRTTIQAVAESAMREVIGRSELAPVLNRDREAVAAEVQELIQQTLDSYQSGVNVVSLTLEKVDPPREVIEAFRDVQAAELERRTFENRADAYANQKLAQARGQAAQVLEEAEGYRAQVVNEATGEASRFIAVYDEYAKAEDVTRKRLYIETLERVLGGVDKIVIDESVSGSGGNGVVPYLPLNELRRQPQSGGTNQ